MSGSFTQRLKELRRVAGLSQSELGGSRYSGSYVSHLESGRRRPTGEVLAFLAERLGVTPAGLIDGDADVTVDGPGARALEVDLAARSAFSEGDHEGAAILADSLAQMALGTDRPDMWWRAQMLHLQSVEALGDYERGKELALILSRHEVTASSPALEAEVFTHLAKSQRALAELPDAISSAHRAVQLAESEKVHVGVRASALMALIAAETEAGRVDHAAESAEGLRAVRPDITSSQTRGMIAWALGNIDFLTGKVKRACVEHRNASRWLRAEVDVRQWGRFHKASASMHLQAEVLDPVGQLLESATTALTLVGNRHDLAELELTRAEYSLAIGEFDEAARQVELGLRAEDNLSRSHRGRAKLLQHRIQMHGGDLSGAIRSVAEAADDFESAGALARAVEALRIHGHLVAKLPVVTR
ncbi:MAG: helix-turn-helix domain-containing protein [Propionibacteriales bacterium]|nr:helix-turn-helix domain-containing protein [Propionibacteriales bacterium]